jgi:integrating conjugative element membrane protein (TIGR03747 family)
MVVPQKPNTPQRYERAGLIISVLGATAKLLGWLLTSLLLSVLLEWVGLAVLWREEGWHHSQMMLTAELNWLSEHFKTSLLIYQPVQGVADVLTQLNEWLLIKTGIVDYAQHARIDPAAGSLRNWLVQIYLFMEDFMLAAVFTTFTFLVRLAILILASPLFVMTALTGAIDGLMRRDLRRFGAGLESSFVYHRAKRSIIPLLSIHWLVYLSLPFSINPVFVLIPCAGLLGVAVAVTTGSFKKYL